MNQPSDPPFGRQQRRRMKRTFALALALPMNRCSEGEMVNTLALTPTLSPGERENHLPLLEISEAMDCRLLRRKHIAGSGTDHLPLFENPC
jgi:hypothetical protein